MTSACGREGQRQRFRWPYEKFDLKWEDIFTTLPKKYNTFQCYIQNQEAFSFDVREIAQKANDTDEFHQMLADRRKQREEEIFLAIGFVEKVMYKNFASLGDRNIRLERYTFLREMVESRSLDAVAQFLTTYMKPEQIEEEREWLNRPLEKRARFETIPKMGRTVIHPPPQWSSVWLEDYEEGGYDGRQSRPPTCRQHRYSEFTEEEKKRAANYQSDLWQRTPIFKRPDVDKPSGNREEVGPKRGTKRKRPEDEELYPSKRQRHASVEAEDL